MKEIDAAIEALEGVIRVADRATDEFDAAKAALAGLRSLKQGPVAWRVNVKVLADVYAAKCSEFARSLALAKEDGSMSPVCSAAGDARMALHEAIDTAVPEAKQEPVAWSYESAKAFTLQEANKLLDAALLKTYPQGCDNGEVFDLWNKARAAIAQAEKEMK